MNQQATIPHPGGRTRATGTAPSSTRGGSASRRQSGSTTGARLCRARAWAICCSKVRRIVPGAYQRPRALARSVGLAVASITGHALDAQASRWPVLALRAVRRNDERWHGCAVRARRRAALARSAGDRLRPLRAGAGQRRRTGATGRPLRTSGAHRRNSCPGCSSRWCIALPPPRLRSALHLWPDEAWPFLSGMDVDRRVRPAAPPQIRV